MQSKKAALSLHCALTAFMKHMFPLLTRPLGWIREEVYVGLNLYRTSAIPSNLTPFTFDALLPSTDFRLGVPFAVEGVEDDGWFLARRSSAHVGLEEAEGVAGAAASVVNTFLATASMTPGPTTEVGALSPVAANDPSEDLTAPSCCKTNPDESEIEGRVRIFDGNPAFFELIRVIETTVR